MFNQCEKIYVHTPAGNATGGVELLHQLVSYLRDNGKNAYLVFCGDNEHKVHSEYLKYNLAQVEDSEVENSNLNVEIYTETMARFLFANKRKTQKLFWWLSVDFYYIVNHSRISLIDILHYNYVFAYGEIKQRLKGLLNGQNAFSKVLKLNGLKNVKFAYQCEYIRQHLKSFGIKELYPLFDYINTDHFNNLNYIDRDNIVLYNPSKGYQYTCELIKRSPDLKWIALKGLQRSELVSLLRRAKVYIDFGNHPGKDRLPRECAINGCCIITGKKGAAAFATDVNIKDEYKFDEKHVSYEEIINKIRFCISHYESVISDFEFYRTCIIKEKTEFEIQVTKLFL